MFLTCYDGWDVADAIKDLGFVRDDGKTLIQQPDLHHNGSKMWTLDHLRGNTLASPLGAFRKLSPAERDAATEQYRKGFSIIPCR